MSPRTIYLITKGEYSDYSVLRAFTERADAEAWIGLLKGIYDIEELKLDDPGDAPAPRLNSNVSIATGEAYFYYSQRRDNPYDDFALKHLFIERRGMPKTATNNPDPYSMGKFRDAEPCLVAMFDHLDEKVAAEWLARVREELLQRGTLSGDLIQSDTHALTRDELKLVSWREAYQAWLKKEEEERVARDRNP